MICSLYSYQTSKQQLERKEAKLEQLKGTSTRNTTKTQKPRVVSPFLVPKCGISANLKPDSKLR